MQKTSLIPSFEKVELHGADLTAKKIVDTLNEEIQAFRTLANPLICDEKYLPFLAYAYKVDFWDDRLDTEKKRQLIKESILLHQKKGTLWALERILYILGIKAEVSEWYEYGGEPYHFKIRLAIEQEFPFINQLQKIISVYKNVRSLFEIDFDLFIDTPFRISGATNTELDFLEDLVISQKVDFPINFALNYDYEANEVFHISKEINSDFLASNIMDLEIYSSNFTINRNSKVDILSAGIFTLHFGDIGSDVTHLPIPPIELTTNLVSKTNLILNMNFDESKRDLFNLSKQLEFKAESLINFVSVAKSNLDFSNNRLNSTIFNLNI